MCGRRYGQTKSGVQRQQFLGVRPAHQAVAAGAGLDRDGVLPCEIVAFEGRQHGRPVGSDRDRPAERVRERSPPRDDPTDHDRREGRLAERHR